MLGDWLTLFHRNTALFSLCVIPVFKIASKVRKEDFTETGDFTSWRICKYHQIYQVFWEMVKIRKCCLTSWNNLLFNKKNNWRMEIGCTCQFRRSPGKSNLRNGAFPVWRSWHICSISATPIWWKEGIYLLIK